MNTDLIDCVDLPILVVSGDATVARFNAAAATLLALTSSEVGRSLGDIRPLAGVATELEALCLRVIADGAAAQREVRVRDGSWFVVRAIPYPRSDQQMAGAVLTLTNVTALRESVEQAIHERDESRAILDTVIEPLVVLDADLRVQTANQAFYNLFQLTREETQGVRLCDLGHGRWDIPQLWALLKETRSASSSQDESVEIEHEFPAIGRRTVRLYARGLSRQGDRSLTVALTIADVTELRQGEETRSRLAAIITSSDDAIVAKTVDGIIVAWNQAAERMFGYTVAEAVGRHISLIVPEERRAEEDDVLARIRRGEGVSHFETVRQTKDGRRIDISLSVSPVKNAEGRIIGAAKVARDITDRKRSEEALRAANRAKDQFLAMLGHELRNPLGAIAAALAVLNVVGHETEHAENARAVIGRQVQHLSRLVDDLLDVSRVTTGKLVLTRRPLDLAELVSNAMNTWRLSGRFERHKVTADVSPAWLDADETRMEQILSNLVGNALKYTPAGGHVAIRVAPDDEAAVLEVADTGMGIPSNLIHKIFDLFMQDDRALHRSEGGLGVGLTLVKALVEIHGGTVEARSDGPGKGSVFIVRLPRGRAGASPRGGSL